MTSGNNSTLYDHLEQWLRSAKTNRERDLTAHVVVFTFDDAAMELCVWLTVRRGVLSLPLEGKELNDNPLIHRAHFVRTISSTPCFVVCVS